MRSLEHSPNNAEFLHPHTARTRGITRDMGMACHIATPELPLLDETASPRANESTTPPTAPGGSVTPPCPPSSPSASPRSTTASAGAVILMNPDHPDPTPSHVSLASRTTAAPRAARWCALPSSAARSASCATKRDMAPHAADAVQSSQREPLSLLQSHGSKGQRRTTCYQRRVELRGGYAAAAYDVTESAHGALTQRHQAWPQAWPARTAPLAPRPAPPPA